MHEMDNNEIRFSLEQTYIVNQYQNNGNTVNSCMVVLQTFHPLLGLQ